MLKLKVNNYYQNTVFEVCANSDKGQIRPRNEDYFGHFSPKDKATGDLLGSLFVVSDGVGGHKAGEVASAEAVNVILQEYYFGDHSEKPPQRLKDAFAHAALHVFDLSSHHRSFANMQCTLTALLIKQNQYYIAHAGDSKAYLLRDNTLTQLTKDHSLVAKLVRMGLVSPEQAKTHPYKHMLIRALGESPILPVDMFTGYTLPGDIFCLVTDGILEHLSEEELRLFLLKKDNLDNIQKQIINLVNERGGYDNMTIMTVRVMEAD